MTDTTNRFRPVEYDRHGFRCDSRDPHRVQHHPEQPGYTEAEAYERRLDERKRLGLPVHPHGSASEMLADANFRADVLLGKHSGADIRTDAEAARDYAAKYGVPEGFDPEKWERLDGGDRLAYLAAQDGLKRQPERQDARSAHQRMTARNRDAWLSPEQRQARQDAQQAPRTRQPDVVASISAAHRERIESLRNGTARNDGQSPALEAKRAYDDRTRNAWHRGNR